jgi:hypothetical protein
MRDLIAPLITFAFRIGPSPHIRGGEGVDKGVSMLLFFTTSTTIPKEFKNGGFLPCKMALSELVRKGTIYNALIK